MKNVEQNFRNENRKIFILICLYTEMLQFAVIYLLKKYYCVYIFMVSFFVDGNHYRYGETFAEI